MYETTNGSWVIEQTDNCYTCKDKGTCTALQLLNSGIVILSDEYDNIEMNNCSQYKETHLRAVSNKVEKKNNVKEFRRKDGEPKT